MFVFLKQKYFIIGLILFFAIVTGGLFFYFFDRQSSLLDDKKAQSEAKSLYEKVDKHFVLPKDELPTVATVTEPEKLQGQSFFAKAKKGDKVLIFTNAKEAILYDPVIDKVVAVAPLNIDTDSIKESSGTSNIN
ncbi:MAG: hypothetical protein ACKOW9_01480, partial [Candidatus Paceibacterota bacterium]